MAKKVRVGIIGLGWPGREHLKGYQACETAEVTAVCDLDTKLAQEVATANNVPEIYSDYKELLKSKKVDAVSVCLPNFLHCPISVDALKAGKHVICEKPPALNAKEAQLMADTAKMNKKVLMYAVMYRFSASAQIVKEFVESGELGDIYLGKAGYVRRRGIPTGKEGWFVDKSRSGGGALIDIGVHALDLVWWLMGTPQPITIFGSAYTKFGHTVPKGIKYDVDDSAFGMIKFANGATLYLEATWALNQKNNFYRQIAGTKGGAQLDPLTIFVERNGVQMDITPEVPQNNAFAGETGHFIQCILEGKEPVPSGQQGVILMQMLDGIYESSKSGKEIRIKPQ